MNSMSISGHSPLTPSCTWGPLMDILLACYRLALIDNLIYPLFIRSIVFVLLLKKYTHQISYSLHSSNSWGCDENDCFFSSVMPSALSLSKYLSPTYSWYNFSLSSPVERNGKDVMRSSSFSRRTLCLRAWISLSLRDWIRWGRLLVEKRDVWRGCGWCSFPSFYVLRPIVCKTLSSKTVLQLT